MSATAAPDDDTTEFWMLDAMAGGARAFVSPRRVRGRGCQRPDWETMVNRLLDWADEARRLGRRRRADNLVGLAWEAYERLHP